MLQRQSPSSGRSPLRTSFHLDLSGEPVSKPCVTIQLKTMRRGRALSCPCSQLDSASSARTVVQGADRIPPIPTLDSTSPLRTIRRARPLLDDSHPRRSTRCRFHISGPNPGRSLRSLRSIPPRTIVVIRWIRLVSVSTSRKSWPGTWASVNRPGGSWRPRRDASCSGCTGAGGATRWNIGGGRYAGVEDGGSCDDEHPAGTRLCVLLGGWGAEASCELVAIASFDDMRVWWFDRP